MVVTYQWSFPIKIHPPDIKKDIERTAASIKARAGSGDEKVIRHGVALVKALYTTKEYTTDNFSLTDIAKTTEAVKLLNCSYRHNGQYYDLFAALDVPKQKWSLAYSVMTGSELVFTSIPGHSFPLDNIQLEGPIAAAFRGENMDRNQEPTQGDYDCLFRLAKYIKYNEKDLEKAHLVEEVFSQSDRSCEQLSEAMQRVGRFMQAELQLRDEVKQKYLDVLLELSGSDQPPIILEGLEKICDRDMSPLKRGKLYFNTIDILNTSFMPMEGCWYDTVFRLYATIITPGQAHSLGIQEPRCIIVYEKSEGEMEMVDDRGSSIELGGLFEYMPLRTMVGSLKKSDVVKTNEQLGDGLIFSVLTNSQIDWLNLTSQPLLTVQKAKYKELLVKGLIYIAGEKLQGHDLILGNLFFYDDSDGEEDGQDSETVETASETIENASDAMETASERSSTDQSDSDSTLGQD